MKLKTINIRGKNYVEVNERIKYFRENYKGWSLTTEFVELKENSCTLKGVIKDENDRVIAEGSAQEIKGSSHINKTSFLENCETSAWGRALGNLGIGIDTSIASAFEVNNAIKQQETKPKTKEKLNDSKYQAMIVALGEGKVDVVQERMNNYKLTKKQRETLNLMILEKDLEIKEINKTGEQEKIEQARITSLTEINEGLAATMRDYKDLK